MRAIIVEDELNVREGFVKLINTFCPEVNIIDVAETVETALEIINNSEFEILFLDINLPDGSGFDLIHRLQNRNFHIVFVTAYDQYAIDAFKISAVDYLLKPVSPDLLKNALQKLKSLPASNEDKRMEVLDARVKRSFKSTEKIILKDGDSMQLVVINDIIYCNAEGSYTTFYLKDGKQIITSQNLKEYERMLSPYGFIRNHHSFLINLNHVISIQKSDGGYIIMSDNSNLPLSIRKKAAVVEALKTKFVG